MRVLAETQRCASLACLIFTRVDVIANIAIIVSGMIVIASRFRAHRSGGRRGNKRLRREGSDGDLRRGKKGAKETLKAVAVEVGRSHGGRLLQFFI